MGFSGLDVGHFSVLEFFWVAHQVVMGMQVIHLTKTGNPSPPRQMHSFLFICL